MESALGQDWDVLQAEGEAGAEAAAPPCLSLLPSCERALPGAQPLTPQAGDTAATILG